MWIARRLSSENSSFNTEFHEPVSVTSKSSAKCSNRIYDRSRWPRHPIENADDMDFDEEKDYRNGSLPGGKRLQSTPKVSAESTQSRGL